MDFRTIAAKTVGQVSGKYVPFSGPAAEAILSDLLGIQDEQLTLLKNIEKSVDRLADVPWMSARIHLEDATIPGRHPEDIRRSLVQAADRLHDAIPSQPAESPRKADARLMLSILFAALGDLPASKHHAETAYREARAAAWSMCNKSPRLNHERTLQRRAAISRWYDDIEWTAAILGDPQATGVRLSEDGFPSRPEISYRNYREQLHLATVGVRWREGAPLDFAYIAYSQALRHMRGLQSIDEFINRSLAEVLESPRKVTLPSWSDIGEERVLYLWKRLQSRD